MTTNGLCQLHTDLVNPTKGTRVGRQVKCGNVLLSQLRSQTPSLKHRVLHLNSWLQPTGWLACILRDTLYLMMMRPMHGPQQRRMIVNVSLASTKALASFLAQVEMVDLASIAVRVQRETVNPRPPAGVWRCLCMVNLASGVC